MTVIKDKSEERQVLTPKSPVDTARESIEIYEDSAPVYPNKPKIYRPMKIVKQFFSFLRFPKSIWLILATEGAERYAFYGFKAVLPLYLTDFLRWEENDAIVIVHAFIFLAYLTPILGSIMADGIFGKYITVVILALIYCVGQVTVAVTAIPGVTGTPPRSWGILIGLALVALGSGGIKPNVSSFGADQFSAKDPALITSFFAIFYLSINLGSTVSTVVTPIMRTYVGYAIAFAIPAILMILATGIFSIGYPWYKIVKPKENIVVSVATVLFYGVAFTIRDTIKFIFRMERKSVSHWVDRAKEKCEPRLVDDTKICLKIILVLIPITMFFALFDQHASRFVFQAKHMNRNFFGLKVDADQIQVINPLLIILLLPVFDRFIYPVLGLFDRFFKFTPLKRIGWGFVFTAISFVFSGAASFLIEYYGDDRVHVSAQLPQYIALGIGEILVSVTAQEFAYQQAPPRMKSIMTAAFLLSISAGNVIVLVLAALPLPKYRFNQMVDFLVFAALMMVNLGAFIILALFYKYRDTRMDDEIIAGVEAKETPSSFDALAGSDNEEETQV